MATLCRGTDCYEAGTRLTETPARFKDPANFLINKLLRQAMLPSQTERKPEIYEHYELDQPLLGATGSLEEVFPATPFVQDDGSLPNLLFSVGSPNPPGDKFKNTTDLLTPGSKT